VVEKPVEEPVVEEPVVEEPVVEEPVVEEPVVEEPVVEEAPPFEGVTIQFWHVFLMRLVMLCRPWWMNSMQTIPMVSS